MNESKNDQDDDGSSGPVENKEIDEIDIDVGKEDKDGKKDENTKPESKNLLDELKDDDYK